MNSKELGKEGEKLACRFLERRGCRIIERNYRFPGGEIDIIARRRGVIVFVEVKTRRSSEYGYPQDSVTKRKQQQMRKTALAYIQKSRWEGDCRFDVISILINSESKRADIELIENAF